MIDDRLQHDRVVGVQPERELLFARQLVDAASPAADEAVEPPAIALQRAVVDVTVADVEIEQLVERPVRRRPAPARAAAHTVQQRRRRDEVKQRPDADR